MTKFAIVTLADYKLPHIVRVGSIEFVDYLMAGYKEIFEGSKRDCNEEEERMLEDMYTPLPVRD